MPTTERRGNASARRVPRPHTLSRMRRVRFSLKRTNTTVATSTPWPFWILNTFKGFVLDFHAAQKQSEYNYTTLS